MDKHLHIITLNIPYPPDYGGMIDTYYRIESLHELGIRIHLHCFEYGRKHSIELESICETVNYYHRRPGLISLFSLLPAIVLSRKSKALLNNLKKDSYPIFFDGLHTTYYIDHPDLKNRIKIVRAHNIEHQYYKDLARAEINLFKKLFLWLESIKLIKYENVLSAAGFVITVSESDQDHFKEKNNNSFLISSFHPFRKSVSLTGKGEYAIFHGDLSVIENELIAMSLLENIFSALPLPFVIAGKNPSSRLIKTAGKYSNIKIAANPGKDEMLELIKNAQLQVLPAESPNGLKLKLLFGLFAGRHCLINSKMAKCLQTPELCYIADSNEEILENIRVLMIKEFTEEMLQERQKILYQFYDNSRRAKQIAGLIFPDSYSGASENENC